MQSNLFRRQRGFTLIELLVTVAIVAILAAIAMPSFQGQIRKSKRTEAMTTLQDIQLKLERWRVDHANYANPGGTTSYPAIPATGNYKFEITATTAAPNDYTVKATPQGDQAKEACGTLAISNSAGVVSKSATGSGNCW
jgi:type IV pilus assembly protein PilE